MLDCPAPYVVDGDSIRCGRERLRLLGIDAPEIGSCPRHRTCVTGDGKASRRSLQAGVRFGRVRYRIVTRDRFGRAVVIAWAGGVNLSCWQLAASQARYRAAWDNGRLIARACR